MEDKEIHILIEKYLSNTATSDEIQKLNNWYRLHESEEVIWDNEKEQAVKGRILYGIKSNIQQRKQSFPQQKIWFSVAAAILIAISLFSYHKFNSSLVTDAALSTSYLPALAQENRYILLADSSIVILKPGSELKYPDVFNGGQRVVELTGEGYFDIKHRANQPFIIHTGKVKTTVLGTAFTIKAINESEVEVFVNRGKVKVENEENEIAVLTANRKLIYHPISSLTKEDKSIIVADKFDWEDTSLDFDGLTFLDIAKKLEHRYDVKIKFSNSELAQYQLSGTFSGIAHVNEILMILCKTSGSQYENVAENTYEIKNNH